MMDSSQTPRAWVAECGITAATLDGRRTGEVYEEYVAYTQAQKNFARGYPQWLSTLPAILPTLTLETREADNGCPQTYFATMAVD